MPITGTTQVPGPVNRIFQTELLRNAKPHTPYFLGTTAGEISENRGSFTAIWRRIENLTPTITPLAELNGAVAFPTRTGSQASVTDVTATAQKYGDFLFLNEEVDLVNYQPGAQDKYAEILGIQAGQSLNRLQRNVAEDNLTAQFAGSATTATGISGTPTATGFINRTDIANTVNNLDRNNARKFKAYGVGSTNIGTTPIRKSYLGICHPDTSAHLRTLTGWNSVETYAGYTEVWPEEIGHIDGVRWVETSESSIDLTTGVAATGSATAHGRSTATRYDVYNSTVYGEDCLGSLGLGVAHVKDVYYAGDPLPAVMVVNHKRGAAGAADPLNEISTMGWKSWHAGLVLNSTWGRVIRHSTSILDPNE